MSCPVCGYTAIENLERCPQCSWEFRQYLYVSDADRDALKQARQRWQQRAQQPPEPLECDPFESRKEYTQRLQNRPPTSTGNVTLRKTDYDIDRSHQEIKTQRQSQIDLLKTAVPKVIEIPSGIFTMGHIEERDSGGLYLLYGLFSNAAAGIKDIPPVFKSELPAHKVRVKRFFLGKYPVTFAQFDAYCELSGFKKPDDQGWGRGNRPVINVSWHDVQQYIDWLSKKTGQVWSLPSEAQWEYAARGGNNKTAYPWGQKIDYHYLNNANLLRKTTVVGQDPPNGFGLYDMHGNVWEWCQDDWHESYQGAPSTEKVWVDNDHGNRVARGGSWDSQDLSCRSACRAETAPVVRQSNIGFRLAQTPIDQKSISVFRFARQKVSRFLKKTIDSSETRL